MLPFLAGIEPLCRAVSLRCRTAVSSGWVVCDISAFSLTSRFRSYPKVDEAREDEQASSATGGGSDDEARTSEAVREYLTDSYPDGVAANETPALGRAPAVTRDGSAAVVAQSRVSVAAELEAVVVVVVAPPAYAVC